MSILVASVLVLAAAGVFVGVAALPVPDAGYRRWNGHVLLGLLALGILAFAVWVIVAARLRRADVEFAATIGAELTFPVVMLPRTRDQLAHIDPTEAPHLPDRVLLAATVRGIELWSRGNPAPLVIPWSRITSVSSGEIWDDQHPSNGVRVGLLGTPLVELPLVGMGVSGRAGYVYADECAAAITRAREAERPTG